MEKIYRKWLIMNEKKIISRDEPKERKGPITESWTDFQLLAQKFQETGIGDFERRTTPCASLI